MVYIREFYPIKDRCLLDYFGLVSMRPWEPHLTLVLFITRRLIGRPNE
jgi:hypothetical protein